MADVNSTTSPDTCDVTVIVPAYNAAHSIGASLLSIAAQTLPPARIIVVDDGSSDGTAEAVEALRNEMKEIDLTLVRQDNKGAGAARNHALFAATTGYVAFLDADDRWAPRKLEDSFARIRDGNYTLVAHDFLQAPPNGPETYVPCAALYRAAATTSIYHGLYRKGFIGTSTVVAKRRALVDAGGFDESLFAAQDFDLWLKVLADPAATCLVFDLPLTHYLKNASGITSNIEERLNCTMRVAKRHYSTLSRHPGAASWVSFTYRWVAVHYEAFTAYRARRQTVRALWTLLKSPLTLCRN